MAGLFDWLSDAMGSGGDIVGGGTPMQPAPPPMIPMLNPLTGEQMGEEPRRHVPSQPTQPMPPIMPPDPSTYPQGGDQSAATTQREELKTMIKSITDRRITIQYAADGEWPYTNSAHAGVRREFHLPLNQPFNG